MSTFFATFDDLNAARNMLDELVRSGVRADDVSLVTKQVLGEVSPENQSVGDASFFVGREDDPDRELFEERKNLSDLSTAVESRLAAGIDTSDITTDVDSVDQSDESQALSEDMLEPPRMTTQSEHERDDLGLTLLTGYPTTVPLLDDVRDTEGERQEQFAAGLEAMTLAGSGTIIGGGALATAGIDMINETGDASRFRGFLKDEGLEEEQIEDFCSCIEAGNVLVAIMAAPGAPKESMVEEIAERWGAKNGTLIDAPRFHENGGYAA